MARSEVSAQVDKAAVFVCVGTDYAYGSSAICGVEANIFAIAAGFGQTLHFERCAALPLLVELQEELHGRDEKRFKEKTVAESGSEVQLPVVG